MNTTAERLKQLMIERGLKQVDIIRLCKPFCEKYGERLERNDLSQYVSGKVVPGQRKLTILSMALGVSEPWLMGYGENNPASRSDGGRVAEFIELFQQLTDEQKGMIISSMRGILSNK